MFRDFFIYSAEVLASVALAQTAARTNIDADADFEIYSQTATAIDRRVRVTQIESSSGRQMQDGPNPLAGAFGDGRHPFLFPVAKILKRGSTFISNIIDESGAGNQIRLAGEGQPGENGGPNGNLYLVVRVLAHKYFRRRENDILMDLDINIAQAALGAEVEVPTVDGLTKLKIPAGIQPGKVLRMRGKGVPHLRSNGRGDQMVVVNVEVPKNLTGEQRILMEQLAESLGSEVRPAERGFLDWLKDTLGG